MTHVTDTLQSPILAANLITRRQRGRFYAQVQSTGEGCWEWAGSTKANGYGQQRIGTGMESIQLPAHRLAWMLANPTIVLLRTDFICHHCDNRACCRPTHLYLGDAASNMRDLLARDRQGELPRRKQPVDDLEALFGVN